MFAKNLIYRIVFRTLRDSSRSATFRIPWTKTTKEEGASVILTGRDDILCPCNALRNHLNTNPNVPASASLFAYRTYRTPDGAWEHMTKHRFMSFCVDIW